MIPKSGNRFSEKIMLQQKDRSMTQTKVLSDLNAMVWKIEVAAGQRVAAGDTLRVPDLVSPDVMQVEPAVPASQYVDGFGNICVRAVAPPGRFHVFADFVVADSGLPDAIVPDARQHDIAELPDDLLVYLLGSRY